MQDIDISTLQAKPGLNMVFEGGAMRAQFTAGVSDFFLEQGLMPERVIGVSAGALIAFNYIAGYIGRACYLNMKYADDWRYLSMRSFVRTGNVYNRTFAFNVIPNVLEPYDYSRIEQSPTKLITVCANLRTGESDYHEFNRVDDDLPYLVATSSLPLLSRPVEVDGKLLLDGGVTDSIPIEYSRATGAAKHIVVLTQDDTYVKSPDKLAPFEQHVYADYPEFFFHEKNRHLEYNATVARIRELESAGEIFVIRPQRPVTVGHIEKDADKLLDLYCQGYEQACRTWPALQEYLAR